MISAIAAAVVIAVVVAIIALRPHPPIDKPITGTPIGTVVNTTAPPPAGQGVLLLSASPWGDIEKIVNEKNNTLVDLTDEKRSTPTRIELAPGKYLVTMSGPNGKTTFDVQIDAGQRLPKKVDLGGVNYDELEKEVTKQ